MRAARRQSARVIGFQGSFFNRGGEQHSFDGSFLYELAGPNAVDGLIVVSNILASVVGLESLRTFCSNVGVPIVSVGELPGFPEVGIESREGLTAAISHLVTVHGRRKLGFIQGNPGNPDSGERELVFRQTLSTLGVPVDERLIVPGTFLESSGATAIRILFEQRGVDVLELDGIVAANDQMAAGAARELRARCVRVPEDVALVGFDDDDHARSCSPPLTTVAQPIEWVGEVAVETLLDRLAGRDRPTHVVLPAAPVFRRSCGCSQAPLAPVGSRSDFAGLPALLAQCRTQLLKRLEHVADVNRVTRGVDALLDALSLEREPDIAQALAEYERALLESYDLGLDPLCWEDLLTSLSAILQQFSEQLALLSVLESRLVRARLLTHEVAARIHSQERLYEVQRANALRVIGSALACGRSLSAIASAIETGLPGLGVKYCCVCLFVEGSERAYARAVAHYEGSSSARSEMVADAGHLWRALPGSVPPSAQRGLDNDAIFPTTRLYNGACAPVSTALDLLIYPLVFAERALGYVVFDAPAKLERAWLLENIAGHLSSAAYALKRADELREARALAERASAAKTEFVAMMSHEVRTPLTAIHGHIELCLGTELSKEQESHLTRAQVSSRSLLRIVDDILDFSKIEAQRLELESKPFSLHEVLEQLSGTFAIVANRKKLELVFDVHPSAPVGVVGDALRVSQVLLNLVGNALKFTERGHVIVSIEPVVRDSEHGALEFSVRDTGIGMSSAELERIFNPFTQADSSMTRRYGGTGLGLSISKRLVKMMGGELEVSSNPGVGSLFRFCLPLAESEPPSSSTPGTLAGLRVLIVEGCQPQAEALRRIVARCVGQVHVVATGAAGIAAFRTALTAERSFDVVLVARALPDMDGTVLIGRLRRALPPTELSALVVGPSDGEFWSTSTYRQVGASATIAKPFHAQTVMRAIARGRSQDRGTRRASVVQAATEQSLRGWSVLVAQDDSVGLELTKALLEKWGANVTCAKDGREAVAQADSRSFSLVLLDLNMPELDGCRAARAIRESGRNVGTIIVALTASVRPEDEARASAAGMDAYIRTPLDSASLLAKLLQIGSAPRARDIEEQTLRAESQEPARSKRRTSHALLDCRAALARINGDQATYHRLLQRFLDTHAEDVRNICAAHAQGDTEHAAQIAHTLASAAANIGASQLQRAAQGLESMLSNNLGAVADWVADLERCHQITLSATAAALNAYEPPVHAPVESGVAASDLLLRARALIENHDTAAVDCMRALVARLAERANVQEPLKRLEASIESYDFALARIELETLERAFAASERGGSNKLERI